MEMETIHYAASLTVILGFIGAVFSYIVLRPLNNAIEDLNKAVGELHMELLTAEGRRHDLELKVAEVEQRAKSNTHRLNRLEGIE